MPEADPGEYRLKFFEEQGFYRKKCRACGSYFWTLDPRKETCEDAPCTEYRFHSIPRRVGRLSVSDARRRFIEFFERNGHIPVKPRPVVARWREDLYLTIASIVVFQPFVTSGMVPPPANPLVISQPCIRLEDIDSVGITFGRHLTSFEMAAHHAFNYPDKHVYWKDRTVELAYRFFTEELGIPEEELVFKESWWEGGGNAGPSFEVTVGGLELATLVFMKYKVVDGKYIEMPLKVVDTGYGVERIAWFTNRDAYTAFDAIYGGLVDEFFKMLEIGKPGKNLLAEGLRLAGYLDPDEPSTLALFEEKLSEASGISKEEVQNVLSGMAAVYALLDHTKTIALMLGDGIVPSNTGEGYLARLVIRRALRLLRRLRSDVSLVDLVEKQIGFWGNDFPQLIRNKDYILDATRIEEERYRETLGKGRAVVSRLLRKRSSLTLNDLILLYDSHGVPPDLVAEEAARRGIRVEVPPNFYAIVASKHSTAQPRSRNTRDLSKELREWARNFPETRRLFHEDPYLSRFRAKVLGVMKGYIVLDRTAFYPRGGGQDADIGYLYVDGKKIRVLDTVKIGRVVLHRVEDDTAFKPGLEVIGEIDWKRRYILMRHHTATHIILGAARRVLGDHVWQAGAEKTVDKARLDITHYKALSRKEIEEIEKLANMVVNERRPVLSRMVERNQAEEIYGFRLYQGGVPPDPVIRIIEIKDWDVEACFGTHLRNTGEVGGIKIVGVDKIQDGVVRLEYVAGTRVAEEFSRFEAKVDEASSLIGASRGELYTRLRKLVEEEKMLRRRLSEYMGALVNLESSRIISGSRRFNGFRVFIGMPMVNEGGYVRSLLKKVTSTEDDLAVILVYRAGSGKTIVEAAAGREALRAGFNCSDVIKRLARLVEGKGGGKPAHATMSTARSPREVVEEAWGLIEELYAEK